MIMPCTPNSYAAGVFDLVSWAERIFLNEKICFLMKLRTKKEKNFSQNLSTSKTFKDNSSRVYENIV